MSQPWHYAVIWTILDCKVVLSLSQDGAFANPFVRVCLQTKFVKSANMIFFLKKCVSKNANFMLISNPLKKLQQISYEKCYHRKIDRKIEFLTLISACKSFRPMPFFWWFFAFYDTHIKFFKKVFVLYWHILLTSKPKSDEMAQKNEKHIL